MAERPDEADHHDSGHHSTALRRSSHGTSRSGIGASVGLLGFVRQFESPSAEDRLDIGCAALVSIPIGKELLCSIEPSRS